MKGFLRDAEQLGDLLHGDEVLVLGEVVFKSHEVTGFLKPEV